MSVNERRPRAFMVRAQAQREEDFDLLFSKSVVAYGWSEYDFSKYAQSDDIDNLLNQIIDEHYRDAAPQVIGRKKNEIRRFIEIRPGDRILVPYYSSVALAEARAELLYDPTVADTHDLSNQRRVSFRKQADGEIVAVPRKDLSEGLQRRLRVRGSTVSDLSEFAAEIEQLFIDPELTWSTHYAAKEEEIKQQLVSRLLDNIQSGRTNLEAGGQGLELLVQDLFELEGYEAQIVGKRTYPVGVDVDIRATKSDRFSENVLFVQVKHHSGASSSFGAEQLAEFKRTTDLSDSDKLIFITSGLASEELEAYAEQHDVVVIEGRELVDWILEYAADLPSTTLARLGISTIPRLLDPTRE